MPVHRTGGLVWCTLVNGSCCLPTSSGVEVANVVYFAFCVNISPTLSPTCPICLPALVTSRWFGPLPSHATNTCRVESFRASHAVVVVVVAAYQSRVIIAAIRISTTSTFWLILLTAAATFWIIQILCFSLFTVSPSEAVSDANNYHTNAMHEVSLLGQQHPELSHNT